MSDDIAAHELTLWAFNDGETYRNAACPAITALARHKAAGRFDPERAIKAFEYWAERAARSYCREFGGGDWRAVFPRDVRLAAAREALARYLEEIEEESRDIANRKRWTVSAIRAASIASGSHFFSRETMRFHGDTLRSFEVHCDDGRVYLRRKAGRSGCWYFDTETADLRHAPDQ
jgi:hypothetical protein